jgi:hypothetical protein
VVVENPGGLNARAGPIRLGLIPERPWYYAAEWTPFFPLTGYLFPDFTGFHPLGLSARVSYLPVSVPWGMLGFEATPGFASLGASTAGIANATVLHLGLGFASQITLRPRRFYAMLHATADLFSMDGFVYAIPGSAPDGTPLRSEPELVWVTGVTFGGGATALITDHFFLTAGADLTFLFGLPSAAVYARPTVGLGYRYSAVVAEIPEE